MPRQDLCNKTVCYAWMGSAAISSTYEVLCSRLEASYARMMGSMLRSTCTVNEGS